MPSNDGADVSYRVMFIWPAAMPLPAEFVDYVDSRQWWRDGDRVDVAIVDQASAIGLVRLLDALQIALLHLVRNPEYKA